MLDNLLRRIGSPTSEVIIVGAGLSGLLLAYRLTQAGIATRVLEARNRLGGRILTVSSAEGQGSFDLGPTWFWGEHTHIQALLIELGIAHFTQYENGLALFERGADLPPQRFVPDWVNPISYRIVGGVGALIDRLAARLPADLIQLDTHVQRVSRTSDGIELHATRHGEALNFKANHAVITLPPRLVVQTLHFAPALPAFVTEAMRGTQTWMGQAMKVQLVYPTSFWRQQGLSGLAVSHVGPVNQFHDASPADNSYGALFGWIGNTGPARALPVEARQRAILDQAVRIFGVQAAQPIHYAEMNWAHEPFTTAQAGDFFAEEEHPRYGHPLLQAPQLDGRLYWAGAEVSPVHGGYLDGAIYVAEHLASKWITT